MGDWGQNDTTIEFMSKLQTEIKHNRHTKSGINAEGKETEAI